MKKLTAKIVPNPEAHVCDCLIVFSPLGKKLNAQMSTLNTQLNGAIESAIKSQELDSKLGSTLLLTTPDQNYKRLLIVSLGNTTSTDQKKPHYIDQEQWLKATAKVPAVLKNPALKKVLIDLHSVALENHEDNTKYSMATMTLSKADYRYQTSLGKKASKKTSPLAHINEVAFSVENAATKKTAQQAIDCGMAIGTGINSARELGNLPGNFCTPNFLAKQASNLAKHNSKISSKIVDEKKMRELGMHALLSVSAGSAEPAKLIQLSYKGGTAKQKPIILVGKGITFDSGGISLKPGAAMDEMKFDMCGAASVMGVFHALNQYDIPLNVVGIIAAAENMPSHQATKPGDVVTSMSGQTIEILNTDAEGRLVLCDALSYAQKYHKPELIVDVATLTGACVIALGSHAAGLYSNNDALAEELCTAANAIHDRIWRMPLWEDYNKQLSSNFADLANIGGREAGSVTAACFLQNFIEKDTRWAHLDIAGVAWNGGKAKGATGRPVGMLMQFLIAKARQK